MGLVLKEVDPRRCTDYVLNHHYARRAVGARRAFGLFLDGEMAGCVLYSQPASYTLCKGVCGEPYKAKVLELSRLVIPVPVENGASQLIGKSLKRLGDGVVVSYADPNSHVGHVGYVYQATNWLYTGKSTAEPAWVHPSTGKIISYTRRHIDAKAAGMGLDWRDLEKRKQSGKHRYVTFTGSRKFKKEARLALKYEVQPYPKGVTRRHVAAVCSGTLFT